VLQDRFEDGPLVDLMEKGWLNSRHSNAPSIEKPTLFSGPNELFTYLFYAITVASGRQQFAMATSHYI
jgi:hypothetical protein